MPASPTFNDNGETYDQFARTRVSPGRVLALFRPYRTRIVLLIALILIASAFAMLSPFLLRAIIADAVSTRNLPLLAWLAGGLIGVAALSAALNTVRVILSSKVGEAIMDDLRVRVYAHLQSPSLGFFASTRTGQIQSRIASNIGGLQALVSNAANELARSLSTVVMILAHG